jgi:endonuclease/exonuclease/phosphatase family metal-dependent hydrolase
MDIRIATFNIAGAINRDNRFYSKRGDDSTAARVAEARASLDQIACFASEAELDILAIQEVDVCHNGADTLHQAEYLAGQLRMQHAYLPSFDYNIANRVTVTTGVATLSRFEISRASEIAFSQRHVPPMRRLKNAILGAKKALHCTVRAGATELHVVNAHLTHNCDRQKQYELETLLQHCVRLDPCVLLGDLNATPESTRSPSMREPAHFASDRCMEILDRYRDRFACDPRVFAAEAAEVGQVCSYPSGGPDIKLDYILLFSRGGPTLGEDHVFGAVGDSNHLPVGNVIRGVP